MTDQVLNVVPTRMELQNLKGKQKGAQRGYELLKKKADALQLRFRSLLKEIRDLKLKIGELTKEALFAYTEVKFIASDISPTVIQSVSNFPILLYMTIDNIAGVRVPDFKRHSNDNERSSLVGLSRGGQQISKARACFYELLDSLTRLAELQTSFTVIDQVLKLTNRRVNAMEYVLIPRYKNTIAFIDITLEENEHEEFFRLKKVQEQRKVMTRKQEEERLAKSAQEGEKQDESKVTNALDDSSDDSDLLF